MATEHPGSVVRRFYEQAWSEGNLSLLDELLAEDFVDHHHGQRSREACGDVIIRLRETFPDLEVAVEDQLVDGDRVATRLRFRGTDQGGLFSVPPTGRAVDFEAVFVDRVVDGRVTEHWGVSDLWRAVRQLGIVPEDWRGERLLE